MIKSRPTVRIVSLTIAFAVFQMVSAAQQRNQENLQPFIEHFGKPIDQKLDLFEVSELYVVRPVFNSTGQLVHVSVKAKYEFFEEHPDWIEPVSDVQLSKPEYHKLLFDLEEIRSLGRLRGKYFSPIFNNSTTLQYEYYENADLEYAAWFSKNPDSKDLVRGIEISYVGSVNGIITGKGINKHAHFHPFFTCTSDGCFYVDRATYGRLKKGKRATFQGIEASKYVTLKGLKRLLNI
jgi:hypothetical protein